MFDCCWAEQIYTYTIPADFHPQKKDDNKKKNVKKLRTKEDSKTVHGPRKIYIEEGNICFKFKFWNP